MSSIQGYLSHKGRVKVPQLIHLREVVSVLGRERMSSSVCCCCSSHAVAAHVIRKSQPLRSLANYAQCHATSCTARRCAIVCESGKQSGPATTARTSPQPYGRQQRSCSGPFWSLEQSNFCERRQCGAWRRHTTCCQLFLSCRRWATRTKAVTGKGQLVLATSPAWW
jgi:hypothetical protein